MTDRKTPTVEPAPDSITTIAPRPGSATVALDHLTPDTPVRPAEPRRDRTMPMVTTALPAIPPRHQSPLPFAATPRPASSRPPRLDHLPFAPVAGEEEAPLSHTMEGTERDEPVLPFHASASPPPPLEQTMDDVVAGDTLTDPGIPRAPLPFRPSQPPPLYASAPAPPPLDPMLQTSEAAGIRRGSPLPFAAVAQPPARLTPRSELPPALPFDGKTPGLGASFLRSIRRG